MAGCCGGAAPAPGAKARVESGLVLLVRVPVPVLVVLNLVLRSTHVTGTTGRGQVQCSALEDGLESDLEVNIYLNLARTR